MISCLGGSITSLLTKSISKNVLRHIFVTAPLERSGKVNLFGMNFDRRIKVNHEDSIKYMDSQAYKKTYENHIVWKLYRRNHKHQHPAKNTRPYCINEEGFLKTSYPCPICRDEYLVIHRDNVKLIKQFIDPYTGEVLPTTVHGVCQKQYRKLVVAIHQAKDIGTLTYEIPDRWYDYDEYRNEQ